MNLTNWIGTIGVALILFAYFLNITNRLKSSDLRFILLNLIGASLACLASALINYMPFIIIEGTWALVSLWWLVKFIKSKRK